jgi:hypothetical protein
MYPPQYNLPPINPAAFGGLPQPGGPQGGPPPPQGGPQGGPPMDMGKYLINKIEEIRKRMGAGDMGALSAISDAMPQPQMNVAAQPPQGLPPVQQQQERSV